MNIVIDDVVGEPDADAFLFAEQAGRSDHSCGAASPPPLGWNNGNSNVSDTDL